VEPIDVELVTRGGPSYGEVDDRGADVQVAHAYDVQPVREVGTQCQRTRGRVCIQAEQHRDELHDRAGGPGLWRVGIKVGDGYGAGVAIEAAEELWDSAVVEVLRRVEQPTGDLCGFVIEAVGVESAGDASVVVRPYRAKLAACRCRRSWTW
jgi:hypothetical protein